MSLSEHEIRSYLLTHHNQYRQGQSLLSLASSNDNAEKHSQQMARQNRLFHDLLEKNGLQNVIRCSSNWLRQEHIHKITKKWYEHGPHRDTILHPSMRHLSIGWCYVDSTQKEIYMTCNFFP